MLVRNSDATSRLAFTVVDRFPAYWTLSCELLLKLFHVGDRRDNQQPWNDQRSSEGKRTQAPRQEKVALRPDGAQQWILRYFSKVEPSDWCDWALGRKRFLLSSVFVPEAKQIAPAADQGPTKLNRPAESADSGWTSSLSSSASAQRQRQRLTWSSAMRCHSDLAGLAFSLSPRLACAATWQPETPCACRHPGLREKQIIHGAARLRIVVCTWRYIAAWEHVPAIM